MKYVFCFGNEGYRGTKMYGVTVLAMAMHVHKFNVKAFIRAIK